MIVGGQLKKIGWRRLIHCFAEKEKPEDIDIRIFARDSVAAVVEGTERAVKKSGFPYLDETRFTDPMKSQPTIRLKPPEALSIHLILPDKHEPCLNQPGVALKELIKGPFSFFNPS